MKSDDDTTDADDGDNDDDSDVDDDHCRNIKLFVVQCVFIAV